MHCQQRFGFYSCFLYLNTYDCVKSKGLQAEKSKELWFTQHPELSDAGPCSHASFILTVYFIDYHLAPS